MKFILSLSLLILLSSCEKDPRPEKSVLQHQTEELREKLDFQILVAEDLERELRNNTETLAEMREFVNQD